MVNQDLSLCSKNIYEVKLMGTTPAQMFMDSILGIKAPKDTFKLPSNTSMLRKNNKVTRLSHEPVLLIQK